MIISLSPLKSGSRLSTYSNHSSSKNIFNYNKTQKWQPQTNISQRSAFSTLLSKPSISIPSQTTLTRFPSFSSLKCSIHTEAAKTVSIEEKKKVVRPVVEKPKGKEVTPWVSPVPIPNELKDPCFAVVHVAGLQYKVHPGDVIMTTRLIGAPVGAHIVLDKVLLIGTKEWTAIGTPMLNSGIYATVEEQTLANKVIIFKKKRRKNYRRLKGYRQPITTLRINGVSYTPETQE